MGFKPFWRPTLGSVNKKAWCRARKLPRMGEERDGGIPPLLERSSGPNLVCTVLALPRGSQPTLQVPGSESLVVLMALAPAFETAHWPPGQLLEEGEYDSPHCFESRVWPDTVRKAHGIQHALPAHPLAPPGSLAQNLLGALQVFELARELGKHLFGRLISPVLQSNHD